MLVLICQGFVWVWKPVNVLGFRVCQGFEFTDKSSLEKNESCDSMLQDFDMLLVHGVIWSTQP